MTTPTTVMRTPFVTTQSGHFNAIVEQASQGMENRAQVTKATTGGLMSLFLFPGKLLTGDISVA